MSNTYYLTQRPPMPGAIPRGTERIEDYGKRIEVPGVGPAWGSATYKEPLSPEQIRSYELVPAPELSAGPASREEAGLSHAQDMEMGGIGP